MNNVNVAVAALFLTIAIMVTGVNVTRAILVSAGCANHTPGACEQVAAYLDQHPAGRW